MESDASNFLVMAVQGLLAIVLAGIGYWVKVQAAATEELRQRLHDTQITLARDYTPSARMQEHIKLSVAPIVVELHGLRADIARATGYKMTSAKDLRDGSD